MNERLSLQDLTDLLAKKQEITKKDAETFLRELISLISENIENNEPVKIKDFGTFKLVKVNPRKSVDVNTGEAIEIAAHYKLSFNPDKSLKEAINRPFAHFESVVLEEGVTFDNMENDLLVEGAEEDATVEEDVTEYIAVEPQPEITTPEPESEPAPLEPEPQVIDGETIEKIDEEIKEEELAEPEISEVLESEPLQSENSTLADDADPEIIPDDIKSKIKEEAFSNNVSLEDIVLIMQEESLDPQNGDTEMLIPEKKGLRKRYIWLGFLVFLIVAGFAVGGLYFQEIAEYLTSGTSDADKKTEVVNKPEVKPDNKNVAVVDSLQKADTVKAVSTPDTTPDAPKPQQETQSPPPPPSMPQPDATKASSVNAPLATETIQSGHTLRNIALKYYGNKSFWVYIYEENKGKIKNANNVPLGTKLVIPAPSKYGINPQDAESVRKARAIEKDLFSQLGL